MDAETLQQLHEKKKMVNDRQLSGIVRNEIRDRQRAAAAIFSAINQGRDRNHVDEAAVEADETSTVREHLVGLDQRSRDHVLRVIRKEYPYVSPYSNNLILNMELMKDIIRLSGDSLDLDRFVPESLAPIQIPEALHSTAYVSAPSPQTPDLDFGDIPIPKLMRS
jgi:hypothetical protein